MQVVYTALNNNKVKCLFTEYPFKEGHEVQVSRKSACYRGKRRLEKDDLGVFFEYCKERFYVAYFDYTHIDAIIEKIKQEGSISLAEYWTTFANDPKAGVLSPHGIFLKVNITGLNEAVLTPLNSRILPMTIKFEDLYNDIILGRVKPVNKDKCRDSALDCSEFLVTHPCVTL